MILLALTTDKLMVALNGAHTTNPLRCYVAWRDRTATTFVAGRTPNNTNGASNVDLAGSPGNNTQRLIDYVSIFNSDTASKTVTIKFSDNGTEYIMMQVSLAVGEKLEYAEGVGYTMLPLGTSLNVIRS